MIKVISENDRRYGYGFSDSFTAVYKSMEDMPRYVRHYHTYNHDNNTIANDCVFKDIRKIRIGDTYIPTDNSFCKNLETMNQAHITPGFNIDEPKNTLFVVVSEPYWCLTKNVFNETVSELFIDIESMTTGNVYRTLYNNGKV